uniref:Ribosomal protein L27 n=1 Tax=Pteridomonas sp. YPF1301 TaxID=2766739 RepID=A0A7G1MNM2_9STRA|nr:ribosomal protein L27 [Pteridomonas sp. YPF1301]
MAHKKGASSTKNGRDSISKRLGIKIYGGAIIKAGNIILRQRGLKYKAGKNIICGKDFTLVAKKSGYVLYEFLKFNILKVYLKEFKT